MRFFALSHRHRRRRWFRAKMNEEERDHQKRAQHLSPPGNVCLMMYKPRSVISQCIRQFTDVNELRLKSRTFKYRS